MNRIARIVLLLAAIGLPIGVAVTLTAADGTSGTSGIPTLKDVLEKGLKARRPEEFAFVATVIGKVDKGELPREIVQSTFLWARQQPHHPFQYFEQGLRERAKKIGVTI